MTAFWRDKYDFITVASVMMADATGRETTRALRVNGDFARVRGIELSYLKRVGDWLRGQLSRSYSRATGLSSTNNDALQDLLQNGNVDNTFETPLAWDRPLDLKASTTFLYDRPTPLLGVPGLNKFRVFVETTYRSGQRYTPVEFVDNERTRSRASTTGGRSTRPSTTRRCASPSPARRGGGSTCAPSAASASPARTSSRRSRCRTCSTRATPSS